MKLTKFFALALAVSLASSVFADAADTLISFSTKADYYADGTPVASNEWYALCWSADGIFDGIKSDCAPYDANDKVLLMAPLAKDGHCPYTVFQVDSAVAPKNGKYCVIMLDTRDESGKPSGAKEGRREPQTVKLAVASANYEINGAGPSGSITPAAPQDAGWAVTDTVVSKPAKIVSIEVDDANATIKVEDMTPGIRYNVKMGKDVKDIKTYNVPTDGKEESATFIIKKDNANYFQLVREPLAK